MEIDSYGFIVEEKMVIKTGSPILLGSEQTVLLNNELKTGSVINMGSKKDFKETIEILERKKNVRCTEEVRV